MRVQNFLDSVALATKTSEANTVNVDQGSPVAVATLDVEVIAEVAEVARIGRSSTKSPSQLCEAELPAKAATKVNFKSLDCSHAFRCDE